MFDTLRSGGCGYISIAQAMHLASVEVSGCPSEDEIDRTLDVAIFVILATDHILGHILGRFFEAGLGLWIGFSTMCIECILMSQQTAVDEDQTVALGM